VPTILLTAFEPFAGADINPSARVAEAIAAVPFDEPDLRLVTSVLPVVAAELPGRLASLLEEHRPDAVLSLGEARRRAHISVESRAVNLLDFRQDNAGEEAINQPVVAGGPAEYRSTIHPDRVAQVISFSGTRCAVSESCGTFCCNQLFYLALHYGVRVRPRTMTGFIHLPSLPEQRVSGRPPEVHMRLEEQVSAVRQVIEIVAHQAASL
jgi:pyroglutamyl-peptidase